MVFPAPFGAEQGEDAAPRHVEVHAVAAHAACCTTSASPVPGSRALGPDRGSFRCFPSGCADAADDDVAVVRVQVKFDRAVAGGGGRVGGEFVADPAVGRAGVDPGGDAGRDADVDIGVAVVEPDRAAADFPDADGPVGAARGHVAEGPVDGQCPGRGDFHVAGGGAELHGSVRGAQPSVAVNLGDAHAHHGRR